MPICHLSCASWQRLVELKAQVRTHGTEHKSNPKCTQTSEGFGSEPGSFPPRGSCIHAHSYHGLPQAQMEVKLMAPKLSGAFGSFCRALQI